MGVVDSITRRYTGAVRTTNAGLRGGGAAFGSASVEERMSPAVGDGALYTAGDDSELQDEIIEALSELIADVHLGRVMPYVLRNEIMKKLTTRGGSIDPLGICDRLIHRLFGYGWLQEYIDDPDVSDIDFPRFEVAMVKQRGVVRRIASQFRSEAEFERFCRLIIIRNGGVINESQPHCRVADTRRRLRINVSIPPRNATGTSLTIRKHQEHALTFSELCALGMLTPDAIELLERLMRDRANLLICGRGGAGKTTLLRALLKLTPEDERVLICESDAEIYTDKANCIVQRISKHRHGIETAGLSTLIEEGLTMSLDTYCIGEITGREAWPFLKAAYSGHRVLATIHAMNSAEAPDRLLMLCSEDSPLPESRIRAMIVRSIDSIVYMEGFRVREIRSRRYGLYTDVASADAPTTSDSPKLPDPPGSAASTETEGVGV